MKRFFLMILILLEIVLLALAGLFIFLEDFREQALSLCSQLPPETQPETTQATTLPTTLPTTSPTTQPTTEPTTEATTEPSTEPPVTRPPFEPGYTEDSDPANWNTNWEIIAENTVVDSYQREQEIFFDGGDYFALPGIASFRGGNYRTDASYGTADITDASITELWWQTVGSAAGPEWGGCGWTGQPLAVQWDDETKAIMNLYDEKKNKDDLVEVIYAKMDGYVHFLDIEDGSYTRDPLYIGMAFKGAGAIDPRGYPLLYLGSGLVQNGTSQKMYIISLIDGSILYEHSGYDSMALRAWYAFDGAPLLHGESDTLIWGGESGLLYTIKLNTNYDKAAGTITVEPDDPVMTRYNHDYGRRGRYLGYEASVTAVENYLYVGDNAGLLQCINANTMELVWTQDLLDDINCTAAFDWGEDGRGYLYVAPSIDYTAGSGGSSELPLCKVDAQTGEILWSHYMKCTTMDGVPGGMLSSPLLGRPGSDIEHLVIFSIGRSAGAWDGQMVALDKETGVVVWQFETDNYMWSSPIALYTEDGKGYIFQADATGTCYLMDGATAKVLDTVYLGMTVESSPIAFGNRVVLGTRSSMHLFKIS